MSTREYLALEAALTSDERSAFYDTIQHRCPRLVGAQIVDVLDMLDNADELLFIVEPMYEHGKGLTAHAHWIGTATRAMWFVHGPGVQWPQVESLINRTADVLAKMPEAL